MKKIAVTILLSILIIGSMLPSASAANAGYQNFEHVREYEQGQFKDVQSTAWYYESVKTAYELGLVNGSTVNEYKPSNSITIAETIALACRIHSIYADDGYVFEQGNPWYQCYVDYAESNEIAIPGTPKYGNKATRAEFAYILSSALPQSALTQINTVESIPDVASTNYAYNSILTLYQAGVLTGNDKYGTFNPQSNIVRSEVSAIITRMADPSLRKVVTLEKKPNVSIKAVGCSTDIKYEITDYRFDYYQYGNGNWRYYGVIEVKNTGTTPIYMKKCIFDLEDAEGHLLQSDDFISDAPSWIAPGEKGYFYNQMGTTINDSVSVDGNIRLVAQITLTRAKYNVVNYEVIDTDMSPIDTDYFTITGRVKNHTNDDVGYLYINCILLDKNGDVLGITGTSVTDLYAGTSQSFQLYSYFVNDNITIDDIASYKLIAQDSYYQWD